MMLPESSFHTFLPTLEMLDKCFGWLWWHREVHRDAKSRHGVLFKNTPYSLGVPARREDKASDGGRQRMRELGGGGVTT